jgi:hypothetical protein
MEKAYDIKVLVEGLKGKGLDLAEDAAVIVIEELFVWIEKSALISETPYDNMALVVLPKVKELALGLVDKIDGKVQSGAV